jgi:hypothetical protein
LDDAEPVYLEMPHAQDNADDALEERSARSETIVCGPDSDSVVLRRLGMGFNMGLLASIGRKAESTSKPL